MYHMSHFSTRVPDCQRNTPQLASSHPTYRRNKLHYRWVLVFVLAVGVIQPAEAGWFKKIKCRWFGSGCGGGAVYIPPPPNPVPIVNAGGNISVAAGSAVRLSGSFSDGVVDPPFSWTWKTGDGNSGSGVKNTVGAIEFNHSYIQAGSYTAVLEVTDAAGHKGTAQITVQAVPVNDNTCDPSLVTIRSQSDYALWDSTDGTWSPNRLPNGNDYVLIQAGHEILLPETSVSVKGLCVEEGATLRSQSNSSVANSSIEISAGAIRNKGTIVGEHGVNQSCSDYDGNNTCIGTYLHATNGSNIKITASRLVNEKTGKILAHGRGGDDKPYLLYPNSFGAIDARGGNGGAIEIYPAEFVNEGQILGGAGGDADTFDSWGDFVWGNAYGGNGGSIRVFATNLAMSANLADGQIKTGSGGYADGIAQWMRYVVTDVIEYNRRGAWWAGRWTHPQTGQLYVVDGGKGGNIDVNLGNLSGVIQGNTGAEINRTLQYPNVYQTVWIRVDPTTLKVDESTRLNGAENVVLFGGEDWVMELGKLQPGAIQAKNITLAVGKSSVIDLRGVSGKVFVADKLQVFADSVVLDDGVSLEDIADVKEIVKEPAKILYNVDVSHEDQVVGMPSETVPVKFGILNNGPAQDSYSIAVSNQKGWSISGYPQQVTVESLRRTELNLDLALSATGGEENVITVTVTSQNDPTVSKTATIYATVQKPEIVKPRSSQKADLTIVLDNSFKMAKVFQTIADALEKMQMQQKSPSPSNEQMLSFVNGYSEDNPLTEEAFQSFLDKFKPTESARPKPMIELITFAGEEVASRTVTDNLAEIVGRIRSMLISKGACPNSSVKALSYALEHLNPKGQIILATAASPEQDVTEITNKLATQGVRTHVLLAGICNDAESEQAQYRAIATATSGGFYWLPKDDSTIDLSGIVTDTVTGALKSAGSYAVYGYVKDELEQPIGEVTIQIDDKTATTDSTGYWEVTGLLEGSYTLKVSKESLMFLPQDFEVGNQNYRQALDSLSPVSDMKVKFTANAKGPIPQNSSVIYTVNVANGGTKDATDVKIALHSPQGTKILKVQDDLCDIATFTCNLPNIQKGTSFSFNMEFSNLPVGLTHHRLEVVSNEYPVEVAEKWIRVKPYLSSYGKSRPNPVQMGKTLHYTHEVELLHNAPQPIAKNVIWTLSLPDGVKFMTAQATQGTCSSQNQLVTCQLGDLSVEDPDNISKVTIEVDATLEDPGLLSLTAESKVFSEGYAEHIDFVRTAVVLGDAKVDGAILLDVTGSMGEELQAVIRAVKTKIQQQFGGKNALVALVSFRDSVRIESVTTDPNVLLKGLEKLEAKDGGTCPEASAEALQLALKHLKPNGTIIFVSDAPPYPDTDIEVLKQMIVEKRVNFIPILTISDCASNIFSK